ncbi:FERM domain-containing protein 8 [Homalodisca vitripennis]|nr:FERM domain-containing protein 8 [Homalodisca vitripennis]
MALPSNEQQKENPDPESGHYITVIPVDYQRNRGFPQPPDQYSDFKTIEGDFNRPDVVKAGSASENNDNLPSEVYKPLTDASGKFSKEYEDNAINAQWEKEKNQQESHSEPPVQSLKVCIYLMSDVALHMELEDGVNTSVKELVQAIVTEEQLGLPRSAANIFTLWMCSGLLELRLKPHHQPFTVRAKWPDLLAKYAHATESRQGRDEPVLSFQRNVFVPRSVDERVKEARVLDLLYCEARYNILEGRYPCEVGHFIMLGGIQARLELGPYNPHLHTIHFFREQHSRFLPVHMRRGAWRSWLGLSGKNSPEVRLLEHYKRIPPATPDRKLQRKYLEFCWALPYYGCAFFQGQVEQPVRGLTSLITHQDIPVLVGINPQGVYVIDNIQCTLLLGLKFEEMSWDFAKPSQEDNPDCLPCIFIQFRVVENGMRVSKILQVFSKQAVMMDALISGFVEDIKKKTAAAKPAGDETDRPPVYDTATDSDDTQMPLTMVTGARRDVPQTCLGNKLSKLTLATFDDEGCFKMLMTS